MFVPMEHGHTLVELSVVLALGAVLLSTTVPAVERYRDRASVVGAREAVAGLLAEARSAAPGFAGAEVHLQARPWRAWIVLGDSVGRSVSLEEDFGVEVVLGRSRTGTVVAYDALGLGRVASETVRFRRDAAEAGLTVSSFGRVRRW